MINTKIPSINWEVYSEEFIQAVIHCLYWSSSVYNLHFGDRQYEEGVDLIVGTRKQILIAVKKTPSRTDLGQLHELKDNKAKEKRYYYISPPKKIFRKYMGKYSSEIQFIDATGLTQQCFEKNLELYTYLVLHSNEFYNKTGVFLKKLFDLKEASEKENFSTCAVADVNYASNKLWRLKDETVALAKLGSYLEDFFKELKKKKLKKETQLALLDIFKKQTSVFLWHIDTILRTLEDLEKKENTLILFTVHRYSSSSIWLTFEHAFFLNPFFVDNEKKTKEWYKKILNKLSKYGYNDKNLILETLKGQSFAINDIFSSSCGFEVLVDAANNFLIDTIKGL